MTQCLITVMYMYAGHSMLSILSEISSDTRWIHIKLSGMFILNLQLISSISLKKESYSASSAIVCD